MNTCRGYEACSKSLKSILDEAREKLKNTTQDNLAQIVFEISEALVDFTSKSEPKDFSDWDEIEQIEQLDSLADTTRQSITADAIEASVKVIMDSTSQLNQLVKKLKSESEKNKKKAKEIRLKPVIDVVNSLASVIDELKEAKEALSKETDESDIAKRIDGLVKAYQNLGKALDAL